MLRPLITALALATAALPGPALADPLHIIAGNDYWHHDSGWIFPAKVGAFERVGVPQDVAGSRDAVAYYAWAADGVRIVAAVDVFPSDSAAEGTTLDTARALLGTVESKSADASALTRAGLHATRVLPAAGETQALYFVESADWRVRIRVRGPAGAADLAALDAFVRGQRWERLP